MCFLNKTKRTQISLAIVKHKNVKFIIHEGERDWSEKEKNIFREQWLLDTDRIILKKVPYKFYYKYYCSSEFCRSHTQHIEDWEIVGAYWNYIKKYGTEKNALEMLQKKFEGELCSEKKTYILLLGVILPIHLG